jgi:hypothetical protein
MYKIEDGVFSLENYMSKKKLLTLHELLIFVHVVLLFFKQRNKLSESFRDKNALEFAMIADMFRRSQDGSMSLY